jgi:hypothetical protein
MKNHMQHINSVCGQNVTANTHTHTHRIASSKAQTVYSRDEGLNRGDTALSGMAMDC